MTRAVRNKPDATATRALLRLLQALAETGACAAPSDLEDETIVVLAPRNGVTIVRARLAAAIGKMAVSQGLAGWTQDGATRRLRLTDAGRAWLRRQATDDEELDPFRAQHGECRRRPLEKGAKPSLVNDAESPLAWLARRKGADGKAFLGPAQVEAGERFRRDIEQAQILQRVTASWEATASASPRGAPAGVVVTDLVIDARKRLSRACEAVGPDLAGLLTDVCGYLKGLENLAVSQAFTGIPRRSHATCASMIYVASSFLTIPAI